jgi:RimJ/RimL family protein N-acetyltransferase/uncharacterized damage-inducible protein DinB
LYPVELYGERLDLREVTVSDAGAALAWATDADWFRWLPYESVNTLDQETAFFAEMVADAHATPRLQYHLGVVVKDAGPDIVGVVRLGVTSIEHLTGDIGYGIRRDLWGRGLTTEAVRLLVDFGFRQLGLHRIFAYHHPENVASGRVLQKVGMTKEGQLRHNMLAHGQWRDSVVYAVLEDEWPVEAGTVPDHNTRDGIAELSTQRVFGWSNMFVAPEDDPRDESPSEGERATLANGLTRHRQTLELKCQGLTDEQLARRSLPPSNMSLLGLIRHMADVERYWFRIVLTGEDAGRRYRTDHDRDADFNGAISEQAVVAEAWSAWREEIAFANQCIDRFQDLDETVPSPRGQQLPVREVLVHMIEEYARHCGHADLLRERIDGRVGQ